MIALALYATLGLATTVGALAYILRQTPHQMPPPAPPAKPAPARRGGHVRTCDGPCRRRIYIPLGALTTPTWWCTRCIDEAIAAHEKEFA